MFIFKLSYDVNNSVGKLANPVGWDVYLCFKGLDRKQFELEVSDFHRVWTTSPTDTVHPTLPLGDVGRVRRQRARQLSLESVSTRARRLRSLTTISLS